MATVRRTSEHFRDEAVRIFSAGRAAQRLLERTDAEHRAVMSLSRDEVQALARQLADVSGIASDYHIAVAEAGSLDPDSFPPPAE